MVKLPDERRIVNSKMLKNHSKYRLNYIELNTMKTIKCRIFSPQISKWAFDASLVNTCRCVSPVHWI